MSSGSVFIIAPMKCGVFPCVPQVFLEPEGRNTPELYIQGFSTGFPERLQKALLHTLPGLENCKMLRPAYAVEYDYLPAYQCDATLETKKIEGLFFSGQINGTTGNPCDLTRVFISFLSQCSLLSFVVIALQLDAA